MSDLQKKLEAWMRYRELGGDHKFYSKDEWRKRKEDFGNEAELTLISEGRLQLVLLGNCDDSTEILRELEKICERHKCFWQNGYSWSIHFYDEANISASIPF